MRIFIPNKRQVEARNSIVNLKSRLNQEKQPFFQPKRAQRIISKGLLCRPQVDIMDSDWEAIEASLPSNTMNNIYSTFLFELLDVFSLILRNLLNCQTA